MKTCTEKGTAFEKISQKFLIDNKQYGIYDPVLFKDISDEIKEKYDMTNIDTGIDMIGFTKDKKLVTIQCKYRSEGSSILIKEINNFFAATQTLNNHEDILMALIISNDAYISGGSNVGIQINKFIKKYNFNLIQLSEKDEKKYSIDDDNDKEIIDESIKLRKYQIDYMKAFNNHFIIENNELGSSVVACGCGKMILAIESFKKLADEFGYKHILIFVPNIQLIRQFQEEIEKYLKMETKYRINKLGDSINEINMYKNTCETPLEDEKDMLLILISTYQSAEKIIEADISFDFAIYDESHHLCNGFQKSMDVTVEKKLFMTATQKIYKINVMDICEADVINEQKFGGTFFKYDFQQAIEDKYISDYKIFTATSSVDMGNFIYSNDMEFIKTCLIKLINNTKSKKIVIYFSQIKRAERFSIMLNECETYYDVDDNKKIKRKVTANIESKCIDSFKGRTERLKIMKWFETNDKDIVKIMANVNIFGEGINVPDIDCVVFGDLRESQIDIIQKIGRGLRKSEGKENLNVLLPVFFDDENKKNRKIRDIIEIIANLSEIFIIDKTNTKSKRERMIMFTKTYMKPLNIGFPDDEFDINSINNLNGYRIKETFENKVTRLALFIDENKRMPKIDNAIDIDEKRLGIFLKKLRSEFKQTTKNKREFIKEKSEILFEKLSESSKKRLKTDERFKLIENFIKKNKRLPVNNHGKSSDDIAERKLRRFLDERGKKIKNLDGKKLFGENKKIHEFLTKRMPLLEKYIETKVILNQDEKINEIIKHIKKNNIKELKSRQGYTTIFNMAKGLQRAYREDRFDEDKLEYIKNNSIPLYSFITRSAVQVERVDPIEMVKKVIDFMKKNDDRIPREKSKSNDDQDEISLRIFLKHRKEQWDDLPESLKKAFKAYKPLYEFMTISYK